MNTTVLHQHLLSGSNRHQKYMYLPLAFCIDQSERRLGTRGRLRNFDGGQSVDPALPYLRRADRLRRGADRRLRALAGQKPRRKGCYLYRRVVCRELALFCRLYLSARPFYHLEKENYL